MDNLTICVQNPGIQPFPDQVEEGPVIDTLIEHPHYPVMVHVIEEAFYICFNNITMFTKLKIGGEVHDRFLHTPVWSVAVTAIQKILLINRSQ